MADTLTEAIKMGFWDQMASKINTAIPAEITNYDPSGPKVDAKPLIKKRFNDGTESAYQPIVSVPVIFPRTQEFSMSFPLKKGDTVLLIFSQRSIENYLFSGQEVAPTRPDMFALSDAIAIPGLFAFNKGLPVGDGSKVRMETSGIDFFITNGEAIIETDGKAVKINTDGLTVDA